ncbi:MAG TPA: alpha/beta fold hydrolase [Propionibacteriaceae bacterium]|jgi:pimeloyl-ACP methyl ester carboxylesterase|nr:alpha/beta fold hydrolase [Propionibacteriaceae bacterium]
MHRRSFVLVPGAGGNAGYWQLVKPLIHKAGFRSVAVPLPNWSGATFADHADAIVAAAGTPDEVILLAQSMGAFSAPLTCDRLPVSELVLLNAMIPAPGETAGEWWGNTGQAEAMRSNDLREGRDPDAGFDAQTHFLHDLSPEILALLMSSPDEEPADSLFQTRFPLTRWPDVPTTVLAGRDDRFFPYEFQSRVADERLGLELEQLPGGHLLALSQPEALVARLIRDR